MQKTSANIYLTIRFLPRLELDILHNIHNMLNYILWQNNNNNKENRWLLISATKLQGNTQEYNCVKYQPV